jgi:hypothetical protein
MRQLRFVNRLHSTEKARNFKGRLLKGVGLAVDEFDNLKRTCIMIVGRAPIDPELRNRSRPGLQWLWRTTLNEILEASLLT